MDNETQKTWMQTHRRHLFIIGPVFLLLIIILCYLLNRNSVSTDDAYSKAANVAINASVAGKVVEILVHDNQTVKRGDLLFRLDQRPYKIAIARTKAELASAYLNLQSIKANYHAKMAEVRAAKNTLDYKREELARQRKMTRSGLSSQMQLNKILNDFNNAKQIFITKKQEEKNILAQLNNNPDLDPKNVPAIQIALANLHQAILNFSYTEIKAPINGIVTKVENLQKGDYVQVGVPVFALVSNQDIWIEANFKETQITKIQPNQKAMIKIDAFPNKKWIGHVVSTSPGTGSTFSLLPPENATGNWVKIVQRLPIRISIDNLEGFELPAGLSAVVTINTKMSQSHD